MSLAEAGERTWIDERADRFERDWKRGGERPRIEDFLGDEPGPRRAPLLRELIRVERELRLTAGEKPGAEEYLQRFPDDRAAVEAAFGIGERGDSPPPEPPATAAHSLLFGLLALQNNFIDRETLLAAFNAWIADKSRSLGRILLDRGALSPARHALLTELVQEHLAHHGQDPERSLAVLAVVRDVRDGLEGLPDLDLQASLLYLGATTTEGGAGAEATASWEDASATVDAEGRFRIVRFHDRGALGEVFIARDQQLHRIVALKRIQSDHAIDREKCARFVVEAEITGRLEHPGIVPVYGLGHYDDGRPFYAMRFIRGDNLKAAIDQFHREDEGRTPGARVLALQKLLRRFLDVCDAIDYAHSRGVLHRDLKPGNIMLGKFGETLVVDWGLAKTVGRPESVTTATLDDRTLIPQSGSDLRGTELGARLGTPAYMSPEQAAGRIGDLGPASDVYSLGATLYCLLTGRAPFNDQDMAELLRQVERGDFPPPRRIKGWVDPALEAICLKAMATDPARRYRTPRALADDVEHWLADERVSAWREPVRRRLRRWGRRHRLLVTGLAATLIVAVGALAVGNLLIARQRDRAEKNLDFAREVVDEMYTGVAEGLEDEKEMDDFQRAILEKALRFYEHFALPQSHDPRIRLEAARAGLRVGKIRRRLGDTATAEQAYGQPIVILSGLLSDHPAAPAYRDLLAEAHLDLARVFHDEERWDKAEREINEAAALCDTLVRERPEVAEYRSRLAQAAHLLADLDRHQGRREEYAARSRQVVAIAETLVREHPGVIAYQRWLVDGLEKYAFSLSDRNDLAGAEASLVRAVAIADTLARDHPEVVADQSQLGAQLRSLGVIYYHERKFRQADEALRRAVVILEKAAADHPQNIQVATKLAVAYEGMVGFFRFRGDHQSAMKWTDREIPLFRSLARRDPRNLEINRTKLAMALAERSETLMRLGRHAEALVDLEEILELTKGNQMNVLFRAFHALTKARVGDLSLLSLRGDEVRRTVERGAGVSSIYGYWMFYYDAACIHAALANLALGEQRKPLAERQRMAQPDRERALDLLEKARSTGEFKTIRLDDVRGERLLDPLRTDPRFQSLMQDLSFPDDPFRP